MSSATLLALTISIIAIGLLTFLMRLAFLWSSSRSLLPPNIEQALRFVPPAVLTALIVPNLLRQSGFFIPSIDIARLIAALVALVVAWRTRRIVVTLALGMATLWLLTFLRL
ncbi:MAG: AzlD domain-containing protein [Ktedonobacterales bacterium]